MADYQIKARTTKGWQVVHFTDNAAEADAWISKKVKESGCSYTDFIVKRIER